MLKIGKLLMCATLMMATVAHGVQAQPPPNVPLPNQQGLARLFFSSRVTQSDPLQSMACFADYIAASNEISGNYGNDYNVCLVKASDARKGLDVEAFKERLSIETSSKDVCERMRSCNDRNNTLDMFNCHANLGANNTKTTYSISGNAAEYATLLQERYRLIDLHHEQCCHTAERAYVENTAENYNHLQACLDGRESPRPPKTTTTLAPTTTASTSTTTTTTTTTTPKPTTTTTAAPTTTTPTEAPTTTATVPTVATDTPQRMQERFAQLLNLLN